MEYPKEYYEGFNAYKEGKCTLWGYDYLGSRRHWWLLGWYHAQEQD